MARTSVAGARGALLATASAALLMVSAAGAQAADLGDYDASLKDTGPVYSAPHMWSGVYVGAHAGYGWSDKDWSLVDNAGEGTGDVGRKTSHDADGWLGGVQAGLNGQSGKFVYGAEVELSWTGMEGKGTWKGSNDGYRDGEVDINWLATVAGRAGMAFDRTLIYGKLGAAFADEDYNHTGRTRELNGDDTRTGWLIGAGIEHAYDANWSVKAEYNYIDFGEEEISLSDGERTAIFDVEQDMHVVKVGLNYRFSWERPAEPLK
ncbi:outer membrane protein [Dichotomicrobium thermohalophilum]|uniref:Outer membrane immunogenic protein n=1 Tax=Dichotomicrobium thermohalophilum TaxID=933063 RepID=A0A397Q638_9HYPH|nr:outer membrane protein [Dichotomicrobium thermohalophilum]RIA56423.1 outer membrane immunogenic protein [Dichotomicrobium thermohalophilum]